MNTHLNNLVRENYKGLSSLAKLLNDKGFWPSESRVEHDIAGTVYDLLQIAVWSDRSLQEGECLMLDVLMQEDDRLGGHLEQLLSSGSAKEPSEWKIPDCYLAALAHDVAHGTGFAIVLFNHLENLGLLAVAVDGRVDTVETSSIQRYFQWLLKQGETMKEQQEVITKN